MKKLNDLTKNVPCSTVLKPVLEGAVYGRASTDALVEAESLKKQEYYGLKYAEQLSNQIGIKHVVKYLLIERYAASGADRERKELLKLIGLIKAKKIKFLIIEELSRLSRILHHLLELLQLCKQYGVAVYIRSLPGVNLH
uniref:recombinase family protein n=1 Tax=Acinetobacter sp. TaxID=472 RepID=UPI0037522296